MLTRRDWMHTAWRAALAAAVTGPGATPGMAQSAVSRPAGRPLFCMFSKPLPELDWHALGRAAKDAGFEGVDLTVRPKGHVLPERAGDDLPRAIEAIDSVGPEGADDHDRSHVCHSTSCPACPRNRGAQRGAVLQARILAVPHPRTSGERLPGPAATSRIWRRSRATAGSRWGFTTMRRTLAPPCGTLPPPSIGLSHDGLATTSIRGTRSQKAEPARGKQPPTSWRRGSRCWPSRTASGGGPRKPGKSRTVRSAKAWWTGPGSDHCCATHASTDRFRFTSSTDVPGGAAQKRTARTVDAARRDLSFARRFLS